MVFDCSSDFDHCDGKAGAKCKTSPMDSWSQTHWSVPRSQTREAQFVVGCLQFANHYTLYPGKKFNKDKPLFDLN